VSFIIQRISGAQVTLVRVSGRTLHIGRGTNAQVRSENASVALEHAVIETVSGGYELIDRGSITGTYLNGRPVESARLSAGDTVELGDLRMTIQVAENDKPLFVRVDRSDLSPADDRDSAAVPESERLHEEKGGVLSARRYDFARAYQLRRAFVSKPLLSVAVLAIAAAGIGWVILGNHERAFRPGPLSVAHSSAILPDGRLAVGPNDCQLCHEPFAGAIDQKCLDCHKTAFHQASLPDPGPCIGCHAEHRQVPNLAAVQQRECIACHRDLKSETGEVTVASSITSFTGDHPEFTVTLLRGDGVQRFPVDHPAVATGDPTTLKFDHECHLNGPCNVRPPTAADRRRVPEQLDCESCHTLDTQTGRFAPVSYASSCARCHLLTFDNRFPPVPHGIDLETVAGVIANAYSGNRELLSRSAEEVLQIFAQQRGRQLDVGSATVRSAQQTVKVRCLQCHQLAPSGTAIIPPPPPRRFLEGARSFSHTTHMSESTGLRCGDCHASVRQSRLASDLSLPARSDCTGCHREVSDHAGSGLERCTTCHYYHEQTTRFGPGWTIRTAALQMLPPAPSSEGTGGSGRAMLGRVIPEISMMTLLLGLLLLLAVISIVALVSVNRANRKVLRERAASPARPQVASVASEGAAGSGGSPSGQIRDARPASPPPVPGAAPVRPAETAAPPPPPAVPGRNAPPQPPADATVMMELPAPPSMGAAKRPAAGTEVIQWHGSLIGVDGIFAGKRIPIDPDGFYIGRDKEMASVVIPDSRVSRRHVWIGVRDGKVVAIEQDSTNGTFLNSVDSPRITRVELAPGDLLILADNVASFRYQP
jgi:pSer/pThr/pTyr-binding forkhead associated (FHA) protein